MGTVKIVLSVMVGAFVALSVWVVLLLNSTYHNSEPVEAEGVGIDLSMEIVDAGCSTKTGAATKCNLSMGSTFQIRVNLNSIGNLIDADGNGIAGYIAVQIHLDYTSGLTIKQPAYWLWPDCWLKLDSFQESIVTIACIGPWDFGEPFDPSDNDPIESVYTGPVVDLTFNCGTEQTTETITMVHGTGGFDSLIVDEFFQEIVDKDLNKTLVINCGTEPTATLTPTITLTNTPTPTSTPTPTPIERTVIVFLRGLGSNLSIEELRKIVRDNECQDDEAFGAIIQALQARNSQKYQCDNLLFFSYHSIPGTDPPQSGFVVLGEWTPVPYDCTETGQSLAESGELLRNMLKAYQDYWESEGEKVKFILVGHSLGGLIAFQELLPLVNDDFNIERLITLDSPLEGRPSLGWRQALVLAFTCEPELAGSEAALQISSLAEIPGIRELNQQVVNAISPAQVITLGNKNDCIYWLGWCRRQRHVETEPGIPPRHTITYIPRTDGRYSDNTHTQLIENATFKVLYELGPPCNSVFCFWVIGPSHQIIREQRSAEIANFIVQGP